MNTIWEIVLYGWDRQPMSVQKNTDEIKKADRGQFIICKPCWKSAAFNC